MKFTTAEWNEVVLALQARSNVLRDRLQQASQTNIVKVNKQGAAVASALGKLYNEHNKQKGDKQ